MTYCYKKFLTSLLIWTLKKSVSVYQNKFTGALHELVFQLLVIYVLECFQPAGSTILLAKKYLRADQLSDVIFEL